MPQFPTRRLHRLPAAVYSSPDVEFYFTVCARHQGSPFEDADLAKAVIQSLLWTRERYRWLLFCYCLMPDHLHFVCRLKEAPVAAVNHGARGLENEGVLDHVARFKSYTTRVSWQLGIVGHLWQKSSYDRVLDLARPLEEVVQYTLENPERKSLVPDWQNWPYARIVDPWWQ
jgi:REP element-mobilizing transposase RayT